MDKESLSKQFPQEVDLGHEGVDYSKVIGAGAAPEPSKPEKDERPMHKVYPRLYLRDVPDLGIPRRDGMALIKYHRCRFSNEDDGDDKQVICIELEVESIAFPNQGDQGEAVDQLSKEIEKAVRAQNGDEEDEDGPED